MFPRFLDSQPFIDTALPRISIHFPLEKFTKLGDNYTILPYAKVSPTGWARANVGLAVCFRAELDQQENPPRHSR